jgi:hypothetical protein
LLVVEFYVENLNIEAYYHINDAVDYEYAGELLNLGIDSESDFFLRK